MATLSCPGDRLCGNSWLTRGTTLEIVNAPRQRFLNTQFLSGQPYWQEAEHLPGLK
jgi:hypothetical protein